MATCTCFEREVEQIISRTKTVDLNAAVPAPLAWITIFKLALIATVDYQLAANLEMDPCPTANELVAKGINEVSQARVVFLQTNYKNASKWEFDEVVRKISDEKLKELGHDAVVEMGENFQPDFELAQATLAEVLRLCKLMVLHD